MIDTIVIGAGWSGLTAATRLAAAGRSVVVVEKSRGPGGRSAARRQGEFVFDHGAQYLTARSEAFARQVEAWSSAGLLAPWRPELAVFGSRPAGAGETPAERWVGVGGMNAVLRRLAAGVACRWRWHAESVGFEAGSWHVRSRDGEVLHGRTLLVTAPPSQSAALLGSDHALSGLLHSVDMMPCWAIMVGFRDAPEVPFDAAFVNQGPLSWIARCDVKAGRGGAPAWVGHAGPEWSQAHLESDSEEVASVLYAEMGRLAPGLASKPALCVAHRWRYAMASRALDGPILADDAQKLVLAGDWCAGERIEGAWISGVAAARRIEALLP
ncbi:NAD(P)/FAD-dependent oxidoreductase [Wenzhouxiangella sediminis]|uniref:FAD-dependent oxidoreductase n=1 Tax=Wenzhouxiangella sediminis TaxID=1792836 RepID=A0A3E1KBI9_9GAMM|nr:FAD-dependent oxidoreductase [Wenzhouxiangella sediminis]RFF31943.1 FAD-dependent oxidoreductase [Wenzhouxiangella sediminis]